MLIYLSNGNPIRGDLIKSAVLRSDLSPVPVTLEAEIRLDEGMAKLLSEGESVTTGEGDAIRIIKSVRNDSPVIQGAREISTMRITGLLDACQSADSSSGIAFVRSRAIIKEDVTLSAIYRAAGARIRAVDADFHVPRFCCPIGGTPSFHIARILQEEGGTVRWKAGRLQFMRLGDLLKQDAIADLPNNSSDDIASGFLERHEVPWFYSLNASGDATFGNQSKPRNVRYSPFKNEQKLRNMSRCLVQRKVSKIGLAENISAGDAINFLGYGKLAVITAAHVFESGTDGGSCNQYTRIWTGSVEG